MAIWATFARDGSELAAAGERLSFDRNDPIFRLSIERSLWVYWKRVGQPDTEAVRRRWSEVAAR